MSGLVEAPDRGQAPQHGWRMPQPSPIPHGKMETLETLRILAALLVVMYHLQDIFIRRGTVPFGGLFSAGDRGVDLFFVLSGFIITISHRADVDVPGRAARYLYRRGCRIFPSVWILTVMAICVYAIGFGGAAKAQKLDLWNIVASAFLLPQNAPALVNVTWTLTYEIFFYGIFATLVMNRRLGLGLVAIWQGLVLLHAVHVFQPGVWVVAYYLRPICLEFGIGMMAALVVTSTHSGWQARWGGAVGLLLAGTGVFLAGLLYVTFWHPHGLDLARVPVFGLSAGAIVIALAVLERDGRAFVPAPIVWLGGASYAIYLVHYSIITIAVAVLARLHLLPPGDPTLLGCVALAVAAGAGFHAFLDRPIQRRLRRFGQRLFDQRRLTKESRHGTDLDSR